MSDTGSHNSSSSDERNIRLLCSALVTGLAVVPSAVIPYYPLEIVMLFAIVEFLVGYRSREASLSLGMAISLPAAIYQSQVFGLYYLFLILVPMWTAIIFLYSLDDGWLASLLLYLSILLGWSSSSSPLSFLPPAFVSIIFTPRIGLLTGMFAGICTVFLAYARGATSYGFMNLPLSMGGFMNFTKPVLTSFGPAALVQPIVGLTDFKRAEFEVALLPLGEILMNHIHVYIEVAIWSLACYLAGTVATRWKRPYPYSVSLLITLATVIVGFLLTGGDAHITTELLAVGVLVPVALAGGMAVLRVERILAAEAELTLSGLLSVFRRSRVEEEAEEVGPEEVALEEVMREEVSVTGKEAVTIEAPPPPVPNAASLVQLEEAFSRSLGLSHSELAGRKILFDYDPVSEYEKTMKDYCIEALANKNLAVVFTRKGSPIYNSLSDRAAIKFFCLTSQVSVPTQATGNEVWLPANDVSLMLDALNKTLLSNPRARIWIVYDNLSVLIFSTGFERTYGFLRYAMEILSPERVAALFLFNSKAHDEKISVSIKALFRNHIECGKEGLRLARFPRQG